MTITSEIATATQMGWLYVMVSGLLTREILGCAVCNVTFSAREISGGAAKVLESDKIERVLRFVVKVIDSLIISNGQRNGNHIFEFRKYLCLVLM